MIHSKASGEHISEKLRSQMQVLRDEQIALEFESNNKELLLNQKMSHLEEKIGKATQVFLRINDILYHCKSVLLL